MPHMSTQELELNELYTCLMKGKFAEPCIILSGRLFQIIALP